MAIWEDNAQRYEARLECIGWLAVNFHRYISAKPNGLPVVPIVSPHWGDIPLEVVENLTCSELERIGYAMNNIFNHVQLVGKHTITLDDLITELGWAFNPNDIKGLKMVYNTPKDPKQLKIAKRKRIGVIV